jgi:hypothetical protein
LGASLGLKITLNWGVFEANTQCILGYFEGVFFGADLGAV